MPPTSSPRLTHFLSIPLLTPSSRAQLQTSLTTFLTTTTRHRTTQNPDGIPDAAVRPLETLHLTLGMMSLRTKESVNKALEVLREVDLRELLGGAGLEMKGGDSLSLSLTLRGLQSMHAPCKTSILYAPPVHDDNLLSFCLKLREVFLSADLLVVDTRPLLLHATILNTIYAPGVRGKGGRGAGHGKNKAKLTINAEEILEEYEDFEWMKDVKIEKIAICRMGAQRRDDGSEAYVVEGEVNMP